MTWTQSEAHTLAAALNEQYARNKALRDALHFSRERERALREIVRAAAVLARNVAEVPNHGATDYTVSPSLLMELRAALAETPEPPANREP